MNRFAIDVAAMLRDLFKPRLVCICGNFLPVETDYRYFGYRCQCGGWMSEKRLREK